MQTSIKTAGRNADYRESLTDALRSVSSIMDRINAISECSWLTLSAVAPIIFIISAGRYAATGGATDLLLLALSSLTALATMAVADRHHSAK